jgi:hypothetical protein
MRIALTIRYSSDSVLCFDPQKVVGKFCARFPDLKVDLTDWSEVEVQSIVAYLQSTGVTDVTNESMYRQIHGKARRNGPVLHFRLPTDSGGELSGQVSRYCVQVKREGPIDDAVRSAIVDLLQSFGAGTISIDPTE